MPSCEIVSSKSVYNLMNARLQNYNREVFTAFECEVSEMPGIYLLFKIE